MATKKVKKKQIEFDHDIDDVKSHKPSPPEKKGMLVISNEVSGEIGFIAGTRRINIVGSAGLIDNVPPNFQIEFYIKTEADNYRLINIHHEYLPSHQQVYWKANMYLESSTIAVIKQV